MACVCSAVSASETAGRRSLQAIDSTPVAATPAIAAAELPSFTISSGFDGGSLDVRIANTVRLLPVPRMHVFQVVCMVQACDSRVCLIDLTTPSTRSRADDRMITDAF